MRQMNFREELAKLTPRLRDNRPGKIYVFGIGAQWLYIYNRYINVVNVDLTDYIFAFIDSSPAKQGTTHMGIPVVSLAEIDVENAIVLISSEKHRHEMNKQLELVGLVYHSSYFYPLYFTLILMRFVYSETSKFSNIVQGGRCFIIGNGPSLLVNDLDVLHKNNEVCFGVNYITNIFNKTDWRPNYYYVSDAARLQDADVLNQMKATKFIAIGFARKELFHESTYYYEQDTTVFNYDFPYKASFSNTIEHLYCGGTVIYIALQATVSMGYKEIYLLGLDNTFNTEVCHDGTIIRNNVTDYFCEKNKTLLPGSAAAFTAPLDIFYKCAREYAEANGIKIYNATRGGALEVFERVNFDDLF